MSMLIVACGDSSQKFIESKEQSESISILDKPYPLNYPSTNPKSNKIIYILAPKERAVVLDEWTDKDFKVYRVQISAKKIDGYVIYGNNVRELNIKK